ncbi:MAG TPA: zinc-binding dehydrogenase, partial [Candidatus Dormibacteraeota bacterium]|nr:zinc-binding dehydrogenase [Candidatus Dormibacteraeota bacterium]
GEPNLCRRTSLFSETPLDGTLAEFLELPVANLVPLPDAVGFREAACLPTAYLTAYHMLFSSARLVPGDTVLVQGASGGVATAAILLSRAAGVRVFATSRDESKRRLAEDLGAAATFEPVRESARAIFEATGGRGVDAVIETVGEPTWDLSLRAVRQEGTVVVAGATGGVNPPAQLNRIFWFRISVVGATMGSARELRRLVQLCADGSLRPLIGSVRALSDVAAGLREMAQGETRGKIVIEP